MPKYFTAPLPPPRSTESPLHCSFHFFIIATCNCTQSSTLFTSSTAIPMRDSKSAVVPNRTLPSLAARHTWVPFRLCSAVCSGEALPAQRQRALRRQLCWALLLSQEPAECRCRSRPQPGLCGNGVNRTGRAAVLGWRRLQQVICFS